MRAMVSDMGTSLPSVKKCPRQRPLPSSRLPTLFIRTPDGFMAAIDSLVKNQSGSLLTAEEYEVSRLLVRPGHAKGSYCHNVLLLVVLQLRGALWAS